MNQEVSNKKVLERYVASLRAQDARAVREFFAEDATWTLRAGELPMSGTWEGRDRIIDGFFAAAMSHYVPGSVELEVTATIAEGDQVVLQWISRALTRDGRPYENGCVGVFTIRDSTITAVREYMDTLYASDLLGGEARPSETAGKGA